MEFFEGGVTLPCLLCQFSLTSLDGHVFLAQLSSEFIVKRGLTSGDELRMKEAVGHFLMWLLCWEACI